MSTLINRWLVFLSMFLSIFANADSANSVNLKFFPGQVEVSVDPTGRFSVNGKPAFTFTGVNALTQVLKEAATGEKEPVIVIKADGAAKHQDVVHVMEAARLANFPNITFATQTPAAPGK